VERPSSPSDEYAGAAPSGAARRPRLSRAAVAEWRAHWRVVLASALGVGLMSLPVYSGGVFIAPLERAFGWSRGAIASGLMINALVAVALGPCVGLAIDRQGPRRFALAGAVLVCAAFALLGALTSSLWSWWGVWALIAVGAVCIHPMVWTSAIASLFTASRGLALAVALCGTALASALCPVLGEHLIERYGWRLAYVGLAAFFAVLVLPAVVLLFHSPRDRRAPAAARPGGAACIASPAGLQAREGLTSLRFIRLLAGATCMALTAVTCVMSLVPILAWSGQSRAAAAGIAGAAGLTTIPGRLAAGWLLDRVHGNLVAAVSIGAPIAAYLLLLFTHGSAATATAAALTLGLALGAELDTVAYLTTRHFGLRSFGLLFSVVGAALNLAVATGPLLASLVYDAIGSYAPVLWGFIPVAGLGAVLFATLGAYPDFAAQGASAADTRPGAPPEPLPAPRARAAGRA
jgi:MFS family permease